jgi:cell division protein ZapA
MKQPIEIEILGQRYSISGEGDEAYVRGLARYVDEKMKEISSSAGSIPHIKLALLAAVNITHELFQARKLQKSKDSFVGKKTKDLIETIDQEFGDLKLY